MKRLILTIFNFSILFFIFFQKFLFSQGPAVPFKWSTGNTQDDLRKCEGFYQGPKSCRDLCNDLKFDPNFKNSSAKCVAEKSEVFCYCYPSK